MKIALAYVPCKWNSDFVLLVKRSKQNVGLPGGKIEPKEFPVQGMIRELKEETGITAQQFFLASNFRDETNEYFVYCVSSYLNDPCLQPNEPPCFWGLKTSLVKYSEFAELNKKILKDIDKQR